MDNKLVQALEWGFLLWPSLLLSLAVALPVASLTNMLKRRVMFDWPLQPQAGRQVVRPWGPEEREQWRAGVMAVPGAAPGAGRRHR